MDAVSVDHERFVRLTKPRGIQDGVLVNEDQTRLFQKAFLNVRSPHSLLSTKPSHEIDPP